MEWARELGYSTDLLSYDLNPDKLVALIAAAIQQKSAAIICDLAGTQPESAVASLSESKKAKIPCFLIDRELPRKGIVVSQILANQYQGASLVAEEFVKLMSESGDYIELDGPPGSEVTAIRSKGFNDVISQYPELKKVRVVNTQSWSQPAAMAATEAIIAGNRSLKGVICANDILALGAAAALRYAGEQRVIVAFLGLPGRLTGLAISSAKETCVCAL